MDNLVVEDRSMIINELGEVSSKRLYEEINKVRDGILVELGVYQGASSRLLIHKCLENNNHVYGIDPIPCFQSNNPNYHYMRADSVLTGKEWGPGLADLVFFDSVHAKEQVLCELYYWWEIIKEGGKAIFHDTSWEGYLHHSNHRAAGKPPGNSRKGYDSYGGIDWATPDKAVEEFFNVQLNTTERDVSNDSIVPIYEDEYIKVETNYALLGMTFIEKKKHFDYRSNISNWDSVFDKQQLLLSFFK
jgi:hypothetical protein